MSVAIAISPRGTAHVMSFSWNGLDYVSRCRRYRCGCSGLVILRRGSPPPPCHPCAHCVRVIRRGAWSPAECRVLAHYGLWEEDA